MTDYRSLRYVALATNLFRRSTEPGWVRQRERLAEGGWTDIRRVVVISCSPDGSGADVTLLLPDWSVVRSLLTSEIEWDEGVPAEEYAARWHNEHDISDAVSWLGYPLREVWANTYDLRKSGRRDWVLVRERLTQEGFDPNRATVADVFPEQEGPFGALLTGDRRLFTFLVGLGGGVDLEESFAMAEILEWEEQPADSFYWERAYHAQWYLEIEEGTAPAWPLHRGLPYGGEPEGVSLPGSVDR